MKRNLSENVKTTNSFTLHKQFTTSLLKKRKLVPNMFDHMNKQNSPKSHSTLYLLNVFSRSKSNLNEHSRTVKYESQTCLFTSNLGNKRLPC